MTPGFLDTPIYGGTPAHWAVALGLGTVAVLAVAVAKPVMVRRLSALAERTSTRVDDALVHVIGATKIWLVAVLALCLAAASMELAPKALKLARGASTVAVFLQVGLWGNGLLEFWIRHSSKAALASNVGAATGLAALGFIGRALLWAFVVMLALDNLGINITTLIAGLGIGGIAVALAVQNILGDLFASLSIVIDKPFVIGDFIIVESVMGTVEHVGLKTTRLRSLDGEQIIVSNSDLLKTRIRNFKRMFERRVVFRFGVTYATTPQQLEKIPDLVKRIVQAQGKVRLERSHFATLGDSSLGFETVYWVTTADYNTYMDIQQAINLAVMRELPALGVQFAFPTQTIQVDGPVRVVPGDRAEGA